MNRPADIYFLRGQFGDVPVVGLTSAGIDGMANAVRGWKLEEVRALVYDWYQWQAVVQDINAHANYPRLRLACGYSLGANALTWILGGVAYHGQRAVGIRGCVIDYAVFVDPTILSFITDLDGHKLRAGCHYRNHSLDSMGHADLTLASDFNPKNLEIIHTQDSHMRLTFRADVQQKVLNTFHELITA